MKKKVAIFAVIFGLLAGYRIYAQPGDANDPLVSKSYVDARINDVLQIVARGNGDSSSNATTVDIDEITKQVIEQIEYLLDTEPQQWPVFVPVRATNGQTVYGGDSTEIILRSGVCVVTTVGENGITDVTKGGDITHGSFVEKDHHLIVPRNDGRGLLVMSDEAWFMIKGDYVIQ